MTSCVTILHGEKEFVPLIKHNFQNFNDQMDLELIIVDVGKDNLMNEFCDIDRCIYLHLNEDDITKFMKQIEDEYKEPNKSLLYYEKKRKSLPNGFLRDYGCGMSSHDNIFHMNADCIYNPRAIVRKETFRKKVGADCIYCDTTLCYDIYGKNLYKTEASSKIYESTLYHTREFWKRKGFNWHDTENEGSSFHYNNGQDRKLDNYYDTVQLLSIHNMNQYKPVQLSLEGKDIVIPELVSDIHITEHPFKNIINELFQEKISILGLESKFMVNVDKDERWETHNITGKWKQTKLSKMVKAIGTSFNVFLYSSKHPAWDLFKNIPFDIIILETDKNYEQMTSIINENKVHEYVQVRGLFIRKAFLES